MPIEADYKVDFVEPAESFEKSLKFIIKYKKGKVTIKVNLDNVDQTFTLDNKLSWMEYSYIVSADLQRQCNVRHIRTIAIRER